MFTLSKEAVGVDGIDKLKAYPVPVREHSKRWKGVPHYDLVAALNHHLERPVSVPDPSGDTLKSKWRHFEILGQKWEVQNASELYGSVDLDIKDDNGDSLNPFIHEMFYSMGVRASYSSKVSQQFMGGAKVRVCANGMYIMESYEVVKHKHTINLELETQVYKGIQTFVNSIAGLESQVNEFKDMELTEQEANNVILASARRNLIAPSAIKKVYEEYHGSGSWSNVHGDRESIPIRHPEFSPRTGWSLYNAFTEFAKEESLPNQQRTLGGLRWAFSDVGLCKLHEKATFN